MSIGPGSHSNSYYLSSSTSSLPRNKKPTSEISKTYKHASQLYLTRRLAECYEILQPVIKLQPKQEEPNGNHSQSEDDSAIQAPIATATTSQRIKIWSLYVTLQNSIIELGDEEGKRDFGPKLYRELVRNVQSGEIWEQVVKDGYIGREASIDAEVVYNLSNLLLAQAPDQKINQSRLETYLSSSPGLIDFSSAFQNGARHQSNGAETPKDLNSRIKILELFTLHVLPRNDEWDYARSFVANSDILDEERKEAFLQTLTELQEAKEQEAAEQDLVGFEDDGEDDVFEESAERIEMNEDESQSFSNNLTNQISENSNRRAPFHRRTSSEVDYGIDDDNMQRATDLVSTPPLQSPITPIQSKPSQTNNHEVKADTPLQPLRPASPRPLPSPSPQAVQKDRTPSRQATLSPPPPSQQLSSSQAPRNLRPQRKATSNSKISNSNTSNSSSANNSSNNLIRQTRKMLFMIGNLASTLSSSLTRNPSSMFRTILFLFAFLMVLSRREIRERVKRVVSSGWDKVRRTAGLGVKVSYI